MFSGAPPVLGGGGGRGNSGAQAVLSAPALINSDGLGTRLIIIISLVFLKDIILKVENCTLISKTFCSLKPILSPLFKSSPFLKHIKLELAIATVGCFCPSKSLPILAAITTYLTFLSVKWVYTLYISNE